MRRGDRLPALAAPLGTESHDVPAGFAILDLEKLFEFARADMDAACAVFEPFGRRSFAAQTACEGDGFGRALAAKVAVFGRMVAALGAGNGLGRKAVFFEAWLAKSPANLFRLATGADARPFSAEQFVDDNVPRALAGVRDAFDNLVVIWPYSIGVAGIVVRDIGSRKGRGGRGNLEH